MFNIASTVNVPTSNSLHDPWSMGPRCQKLRVGTWQGAHPSAVHKWTEDAEEVEGIEVEVAHEERSCGIICICLCLLLISFVGLSYFSQHVHWSVLQNIELGICMFYWMCFWYFKAIFSGLFSNTCWCSPCPPRKQHPSLWYDGLTRELFCRAVVFDVCRLVVTNRRVETVPCLHRSCRRPVGEEPEPAQKMCLMFVGNSVWDIWFKWLNSRYMYVQSAKERLDCRPWAKESPLLQWNHDFRLHWSWLAALETVCLSSAKHDDQEFRRPGRPKRNACKYIQIPRLWHSSEGFIL